MDFSTRKFPLNAYFFVTLHNKIHTMEGNKLLFVGERIVPFLPDSPMAAYGKAAPKYISENGMEVRALQPKFGNINERRNQLHEVIRLSGLNIDIANTDHPLIIKVASLPGTRLQVYFIDNDDLFKKRGLFMDNDGNEYADNYERAIFYARSTMETCKLLHWTPCVIQCQGWFSTLVAFYLKNAYLNEENFAQSKVVLTLYGEQMNTPLPDNFAEMLCFRTITKEVIDNFGMPLLTFEDLMRFSIKFADGIICGDKDVPEDLISFARENQIPVMPFNEENFPQKTLEFFQSIKQSE